MLDYMYVPDWSHKAQRILATDDLIAIAEIHMTAAKYIVYGPEDESFKAFMDMAPRLWASWWTNGRLAPVIGAIYACPRDSTVRMHEAAVQLTTANIQAFREHNSVYNFPSFMERIPRLFAEMACLPHATRNVRATSDGGSIKHATGTSSRGFTSNYGAQEASTHEASTYRAGNYQTGIHQVGIDHDRASHASTNHTSVLGRP
jgi:hypothetical protein